MKTYLNMLLFIYDGQVGHGGVDRLSFSDARGLGFEPRPLYHFFTPKPRGIPSKQADHPGIFELSERGGSNQKNLYDGSKKVCNLT